VDLGVARIHRLGLEQPGQGIGRSRHAAHVVQQASRFHDQRLLRGLAVRLRGGRPVFLEFLDKIRVPLAGLEIVGSAQRHVIVAAEAAVGEREEFGQVVVGHLLQYGDQPTIGHRSQGGQCAGGLRGIGWRRHLRIERGDQCRHALAGDPVGVGLHLPQRHRGYDIAQQGLARGRQLRIALLL
jgi:hypothetical protein